MKFELPENVDQLSPEIKRDMHDALAQVQIAQSLFGDAGKLFRGIANLAVRGFNFFYPTAAMRSQRSA